MKKLFAFIAILAPLFAFAGPEDHTPGAVYRSTTATPYYLSQLVFDSAKLSNDEQTITLEARYGNLIGDFKVTNTVRINEDKVSFTAEKVLFTKWESGCGDGETAKAVIQAVNHVANGINAKDMKITVEYATTNDTCHSRPQVQVINYQLAE